MKEIKILYLYPDMLELYGDYGNIQVLKYRIEARGYKAIIDRYSIGDNAPNFNDYDIVFAGGGADNEQSILADDLVKYKDNIKDAVNNGVFFLLICGAYQLFGKYYKGVEGNIIPGLEVFDYYTVANPDRKKRCIGNIVIEATLNGVETKVIGFENHGGRTCINDNKPLGKVLYGKGNDGRTGYEGVVYKNVIGTYLHGPLLPKNPQLADWLILKALQRKYGEQTALTELDDSQEKEANDYIFHRFTQNR